MTDNYRPLGKEEIDALASNGCRAEDWNRINVAAGFDPQYIRNVSFHGDIRLGVFEKKTTVGNGFDRHSGIFNATLRNVTVGDNSLIENIGGHINNYDIGRECHICNCGTIETTEGATFGTGSVIAVMNEAGTGNVVVSDKLTSNIAALTVTHGEDGELYGAIKKMTDEYVAASRPQRGKAGNRVKITDTTEVTNTVIGDRSEICGAQRLRNCTLSGTIGAGVICDNTVVAHGCSIHDNAILENCFVSEACCIKNGFSAENSIFFANTYMSNGEACAAFCGPFTASHHKSSLLIGAMYSFYNAGSATNFSNHAYKMGPIHHGTLERGTKTASGAHILLPARLGAFSMCMGKITCHPDTTGLPFSYIIAEGRKTYIVPARNLVTAGIFRDTRKWERRDMRRQDEKRSIINFDWLSPFTVMNILKGRSTLEEILGSCDENTTECTHGKCTIKVSSLKKGICLYDMAIAMFIGSTMIDDDGHKGRAAASHEWHDLSGLLIPAEEEDRLIGNIKDGSIRSLDELQERLEEIHHRYPDYRRAYARLIAKEAYGLDTDDEKDRTAMNALYRDATDQWADMIRKDAENEYRTGDVDAEVLDKFLKEVEQERANRLAHR